MNTELVSVQSVLEVGGEPMDVVIDLCSSTDGMLGQEVSRRKRCGLDPMTAKERKAMAQAYLEKLIATRGAKKIFDSMSQPQKERALLLFLVEECSARK